MTMTACAKHKTPMGGDVCIALNNARLEARLHESASTSSYHEAWFAPVVAADKGDDSNAPETSYREGFELSLKPLYESDTTLYAQYDIVAEQVTGWEFVGNEGTSTARRPVIQRTHVFGTTKLAVGEATTLERNGYTFVITYVQRGGVSFVGER
ncbi:hypothetical protein [Burkholderia cenocepacia]|uniref:hypothetical protein n=1 Tax=Burkholderia cenocepacia TaxID=95486 RepID=UPI0012372F07|nr:hypothetical protein [Burkholderia cenocepacia]